MPLDTPTPLCSELGVYVRAGRTPPAALDAFNRIVAEAIDGETIAFLNTTNRKGAAKIAETYVCIYPNAGLPNPMSDTGFD